MLSVCERIGVDTAGIAPVVCLPITAEWLDGSLPGDRGFDPLGLSRPSDFVQVSRLKLCVAIACEPCGLMDWLV
jgi:hypothetical protein